jgi:SH3-like domain-containing protein
MTGHKNHKTFLTRWVALFLLMIFWGAQAEALCIKEKRANLRKGPGLTYEKLWEVFKYMPFQQIGKKGEWLRVKDVDGDIYWVHQRLISKKFKCAVIKQNKTNLREGPSTKHPAVNWSPVNKYFSLKVLKITKNWVRVVDAVGDKAWVYRPLVWIR